MNFVPWNRFIVICVPGQQCSVRWGNDDKEKCLNRCWISSCFISSQMFLVIGLEFVAKATRILAKTMNLRECFQLDKKESWKQYWNNCYCGEIMFIAATLSASTPSHLVEVLFKQVILIVYVFENFVFPWCPGRVVVVQAPPINPRNPCSFLPPSLPHQVKQNINFAFGTQN